jgi:hypothetical protein
VWDEPFSGLRVAKHSLTLFREDGNQERNNG